MGYGTGAIMAVPAHDQRDLEFAAKFDLDVKTVIQPSAAWFAGHAIPDSTPARQWPEAFTGDGRYLSGWGSGSAGQSKDEAIKAAISWLEESGKGKRTRSYRLRDWLFSRQRYWGEPFPIVYDDSGRPRALPEDMLPVTLPEMKDFRPEPQADEDSEPVPPLARAVGWTETELDLGDGSRRYRRELNTMPQWAGSCWYYLRYLDPANDKAFVDAEVERYWMPLPGGTPGDGGVDLYVGGVEHAVLHLLYARFWHKVLYDLGHVSTKEPFWRLFNQGYIQADAFTDARGMYVPAAEVAQHTDGTCTYRGQPVRRRAGKMGKSLKNSVAPDDIYARYGADTLRLYEMVMGPLDADRPWRTDDIVGVYRLLQRLWRCMVSETTGETQVSDDGLDEETGRLLHRTIKAVRKDFGELRFNTAIARLIELTSHAARLATAAGALPRALAEPLVLMVAPLAPHITEELWRRLGHQQSLIDAPFPVHDEALAAAESIVLPVQINGKARFTLEVPAAAGEAEIRRILERNQNVARYTENAAIERLVIVPGKIVSIVLDRRKLTVRPGPLLCPPLPFRPLSPYPPLSQSHRSQ